jgi:hypothetical protein
VLDRHRLGEILQLAYIQSVELASWPMAIPYAAA